MGEGGEGVGVVVRDKDRKEKRGKRKKKRRRKKRRRGKTRRRGKAGKIREKSEGALEGEAGERWGWGVGVGGCC